MSHTDTYKDIHTVSKEEFLDFFTSERLQALKGQGPRVCELSNTSANQFSNAKQGRISNPIILGALLEACKIVLQELQEQYTVRANSNNQ